jgi:hypothetical protein
VLWIVVTVLLLCGTDSVWIVVGSAKMVDWGLYVEGGVVVVLVVVVVVVTGQFLVSSTNRSLPTL